MRISGPDLEALKFEQRMGNWNLYVEEAFEKHLKNMYDQIQKGFKPNLWYGLPKIRRKRSK